MELCIVHMEDGEIGDEAWNYALCIWRMERLETRHGIMHCAMERLETMFVGLRKKVSKFGVTHNPLSGATTEVRGPAPDSISLWRHSVCT